VTATQKGQQQFAHCCATWMRGHGACETYQVAKKLKRVKKLVDAYKVDKDKILLKDKEACIISTVND
jgi:hypothetical protein